MKTPTRALQMRLLALVAFVQNASLVAAKVNWPSTSYFTENLPSPGFDISVSKHTQPGYFFFGIIGNGYIPPGPIITKDTGELVWRGPAIETHDVKLQTLNQETVMTYWTGYGDNFGHGYGNIDILDNTYKTLYSVCLEVKMVTPNPSVFPGNRANPCYFDSHENMIISNRGTVVGTAFNVTPADLTAFNGPQNGFVFDAQFYEVDIETNEVVFSWSSLDHVPLTQSNYFGTNNSDPLVIGKTKKGLTQSLPWDYFHINSVQPVLGGYLVNSRMTWSMYYVDGITGNIVWTLEGNTGGDFTLDKGIFFSWEHMPRILKFDKRHMIISLFNNDNINSLYFGKNQSTGYLLSVDFKTKFVTAVKDLLDNSDPIYTAAEGSYQALDKGHTLMGYGSRPTIKEFDNAGNVVYNAQWAPFSDKGVDSNHGQDVHSYRTYRFQWDAQPTTSPSVAAVTSGDGRKIHIYMSWNGATTYNHWNVYAGSSPDDMEIVASKRRHGFETGFTLRGDISKYNYVVAEALDGSNSLGTSEATQVKAADQHHHRRSD